VSVEPSELAARLLLADAPERTHLLAMYAQVTPHAPLALPKVWRS
jgi:hypothetical protein